MGRKNLSVERQAEILEHFYEVLTKQGLEGASIGKLAKRMGVNPSLIIHYFKTKDELVLAMVDAIIAKYESSYMEQILAIPDPKQRLMVILDAYFSSEWNDLVNQSVFSSCYSLAMRNDVVKEKWLGMYERLRSLMTEQLIFFMDEGVIAKQDPKLLAQKIISMQEGVTYGINVGFFTEAMLSSTIEEVKELLKIKI